MVWRPIGSSEPSFFWTEFGEAIVGSTFLRVSHTFAQQPNGPALLRMNFIDGYSASYVLYPSTSKRLIEMKVPQPLIDKGIVVWYPALRLGFRTRPHENDNWQVYLEELI